MIGMGQEAEECIVQYILPDKCLPVSYNCLFYVLLKLNENLYLGDLTKYTIP